MNKREIFDHVKNHLIKQGKPSVIQNKNNSKFVEFNCAYRGTNGTSCAVGCLIKDEYYSEELEGRLVEAEIVCQALSKSIGREINNEDIELLLELQELHDDAAKDTQYWGHVMDVGLDEIEERHFQ
jgi:hypothetical protein